MTTDDLKEVLVLLLKARDKWYNIGIELQIDVEELNMIDYKFDDLGDKLVHMLQAWLKLFGPEPTWSDLARALKAEEASAEKGMKVADMKTNKQTTNIHKLSDQCKACPMSLLHAYLPASKILATSQTPKTFAIRN